VAGTDAEHCWLVSSNGFDVIGAVSAGMKAAWLQRSSAVVFDPWGIDATLVVSSLSELSAKINL
jgi:2-haloacid dehalogenase